MRSSPYAALATAVRDMLSADLDVNHTLGALLASGADFLDVAAVAVLVVEDASGLALLSSSSHEPDSVEMFQEVAALGLDERVLASRDHALLDAPGGSPVDVLPMRWHGAVLGATVVLRHPDGDAPDLAVAATLAETATLVIAQMTAGGDDELRAALHEALVSRDVLEQAKGLVAYARGIDLDEAHAQLRSRAGSSGRGVTEVASDVVAARGLMLP